MVNVVDIPVRLGGMWGFLGRMKLARERNEPMSFSSWWEGPKEAVRGTMPVREHP